MAVDWKYTGEIRKAESGEVVPEGEWVLFRVKDVALPDTLWNYYETCKEMGASDDHLTSIRMLWGRVLAWQKAHPEQVKVPD